MKRCCAVFGPDSAPSGVDSSDDSGSALSVPPNSRACARTGNFGGLLPAPFPGHPKLIGTAHPATHGRRNLYQTKNQHTKNRQRFASLIFTPRLTANSAASRPEADGEIPWRWIRDRSNFP